MNKLPVFIVKWKVLSSVSLLDPSCSTHKFKRTEQAARVVTFKSMFIKRKLSQWGQGGQGVTFVDILHIWLTTVGSSEQHLASNYGLLTQRSTTLLQQRLCDDLMLIRSVESSAKTLLCYESHLFSIHLHQGPGHHEFCCCKVGKENLSL